MNKQIMMCLVTFSFIAVLFMPAAAFGQEVPELINYQGMLTDSSGTAVEPDGIYTVEFRIWSHSTETEAQYLVWGRIVEATVIKGHFNVILSDDSPPIAVPTGVNSLRYAFNEEERYLGITIINTPEGPVSAPTQIEPRQRILSTPYALRSLNGVPAGAIQAFAGPVDKKPEGWLVCDGSPKKSSEFKQLYDAILNTWGNGSAYADGTPEADDETDFNLPDLRGQFLRGDDLGSGRDEGPETKLF